MSNTFPLSVHLIIKERPGTQRQSFALENYFPRIVNVNLIYSGHALSHTSTKLS